MNTQDMNQMMRELMDGLSEEQKKQFESEENKSEREAVIQKLLNDFFPTYIFLISQSGKLMTVFGQTRYETAMAIALMAGIAVGAMTGDQKKAQSLLRMSLDIAKSVADTSSKEQDGGADTFAQVMATSDVVEMQLIKAAIESHGSAINPRKGELRDKIMKDIKKKPVGRE